MVCNVFLLLLSLSAVNIQTGEEVAIKLVC